MKTLIILDNLVNDYCGNESEFLNNNVNIGVQNIANIFGSGKKHGYGPLPTFLQDQKKKSHTDLIFFRDIYSNDQQINREHLERFGNHCIEGTYGAEFLDCLEDLVEDEATLDCSGLTFPIHAFNSFFKDTYSIDLFNDSAIQKHSNRFRILVLGFHTERRIFSIANVLRNLFGFEFVAVFSPFLASANQESHFTSLRYLFPDNLIQVINSLSVLSVYLNDDLHCLAEFNLEGVKLLPDNARAQIGVEQSGIIESICMHWTAAELKPLSGGFSGSSLFVANGKQGDSIVEPMVIKIDEHAPMRMELKGYNLVKDLLGKHIPTFTLPVRGKNYTGIGMELASMEGSPRTLQSYFEDVDNDYDLDECLKILDQTLNMLSNRVYSNTRKRKLIAPYRHFMLHIAQQPEWFSENLKNLKGQPHKGSSMPDDMLINLFNSVRKNSDALFSEISVGHGDLNFANIIVDKKGNLWTIDWTNGGYHPLETDFAKMENDVKFVMSKSLQEDDLNKLKILEDYLLDHCVPGELEELPSTMQFVCWDIRIKKIYLTVKKIRSYYRSLKKEENWLIYKIALLKYGLHTLSFDKALGQGECAPSQLSYTLLSVENILFQLIADDYHLKIRSERPSEYPERQRIQIDYANWQNACSEYDPPYFVSDEVLSQPEEMISDGSMDKESDHECVNFIDWGRPFMIASDKRPLNPSGRTGIAGRGALWLWGPNPMYFLVPIRYNHTTAQLELLSDKLANKSEILAVHYKRGESDKSAYERLLNKSFIDTKRGKSIEVHSGYLYDPRQTDNAWVEAKCNLLYYDDKIELRKEGRENLVWLHINSQIINNMYSSHGLLLRKAIEYIYNKIHLESNYIKQILDKTG